MHLKKLAAAIAISSIAVSGQVAIADAPKPAFASPDGRQVPYGHWQFFFTPSHLLPLSYLPLDGDARATGFSSVLPPCDGSQSACIFKVEYQIDNGSWESAIPGADEGQRAIAYGLLNGANNWVQVLTSTFPENISLGRPQGATARLWSFPKAPHGAGDKYQVAANFKGFRDPNGKYSTDSFYLEVTPVTRGLGNSSTCIQPSIFEARTQFSMDGYCKTIYDFPETMKVRVTLKLGEFLEKVKGWYDGRIREAQINIDSQSRTLTIEGSPMLVPSAAIRPLKYSEIPKTYSGAPTPEVIETQNRGPSGTAGMGDANRTDILDSFLTMEKDLLPNAIGENTIWKVSSISSPGTEKCLQAGTLNGLVTTNAIVYNASAPAWNSEQSSLDFKVAATHLDSKSQIFKGYYKMLVSEKVAQCYWGSDFSRGTASISITNQDGSPNVATTNLGLRDGWVNFEAAGFTFSSPTISAIIKRAPVVVASPTPSPSPTPTIAVAPKKVTITCVSASKKLKKVTGTNPKCPAGYKKK